MEKRELGRGNHPIPPVMAGQGSPSQPWGLKEGPEALLSMKMGQSSAGWPLEAGTKGGGGTGRTWKVVMGERQQLLLLCARRGTQNGILGGVLCGRKSWSPWSFWSLLSLGVL